MPSYKGPGEPKDPKEKPLDYEGFKALLVASVDKYPPPEVRLPMAIDTGEFGKTAQMILKDTTSDPEERERAYVVIATLDGGLRMTDEPQIGTRNEVGGEHTVEGVKYRGLPSYYAKEEHTAMRIHSHCDDRPPSIADCANLIIDMDKGFTAEIVATTGGYYLVMRTLEGVDLEKSEAETIKWIKELKWELGECLKIVDQEAIGTQESIRQQRLAMKVMLQQISAKYHLAVYTSPEGIIYTKTTL